MNSIARVGSRLGLHSDRAYALVKYGIDLALWSMLVPLAYLLRVEDRFALWLQSMWVYTLAGMVVKAVLIRVFLLHRQSWHKIGVLDLYRLLYAIGAATVILEALALIIRPWLVVPRSVPLIEGVLAVLVLAGARLGVRLFNERLGRQASDTPAQRVLIAGAGEAGTLLAREMLRHPHAGLAPVGYLDDDPQKRRGRFFGLPVLGRIDELPRVVKHLQVDEVLIAMPSESGEVIRRVVELARRAEVRHRTIPGMYEILSGKVSISAIREVDVEDLLRREPVRLDMKEIAAYLQGRTVLVTGAAGSIGSELVRQITPFEPAEIIILDREENNLYLFERELQAAFPGLPVHSVVADIRQRPKLEQIFAAYRPQVVFHAAAYKHVPVMEANPGEAILNNVGGTRNLVEVAETYGVARFVNISTDKAVHPTSVMGASKRVGEYLVEEAAARAADGRCFVSVRFGNVLGSRGSVVPIFKEQIARGGPVTITDPDMTRYFMSIPEAAQLVLQAAGLGQNGAVYVLDMGQPVRILDLAHDLIRLSGLEPGVDVPVEVVGRRPGEKMYEEILTAEEGTIATRHEKIYCARKNGGPGARFHALLDDLLDAADRSDDARLRSLLREIVPSYQPAANGRHSPAPEPRAARRQLQE